MLVYIEGRIQTRQWEDKRDGQKNTTTEIVANVMRMLTSRAESGAASGQARSADIASDAGVAADESAQSGPEISDEDIPF